MMTFYENLWDKLSGGAKDVFIQLKKVRWDGNISSKTGRDELISKGLAVRYEGFTCLTINGLIILQKLGKLEDLTK